MGAAPVLTILKDGEKVKSCSIEGEALLGRSEGCVIRLEHQSISRQHAVFRALPEGVQVEKKSEFGPLLVNGAECTEAIVREGDVISIGPYLMRVAMPAGGGAEPAALPKPEPARLHAVPAPDPGSNAETFTDAEASPDSLAQMPGLSLVNPESEASPGGEGLTFEPTLVLGAGESSAPQLDTGDGALTDDGGQATQVLTVGAIEARLSFQPGTANVDEYVISKEEVSLGRGKACDIVLADRKASRKNSLILRVGKGYFLKDLGSVNGTYLNGDRLDENQERELTSEDRVRIGDVEFEFKAMSAGYSEKQQEFLPVEQPVPEHEPQGPLDSLYQQHAMDTAHAEPTPSAVSTAGTQTAIPGIVGIGANAAANNKSIIAKIRALPPRQQVYVGVIAVLFLWWFMEEEEPAKAPSKPATEQKASSHPGEKKPAATFEELPAEIRAYIEAQHDLAFNHLKNREFDKALYEVRKIFDHIQDYKLARQIEEYALDGQRRLQAQAEEKRRKEEEARLKARIAELVEETGALMNRNKFEQAREKFAEIMALDPENATVAKWRKQIQDYEEEERRKEQEAQVRAEVNRRGWEIFNVAIGFLKKEQFLSAIDSFQQVLEVGASDKKLLTRAKAMVTQARERLEAKLRPLLEQGKDLESNGDLAGAFKMYEKAAAVDPSHPDPVDGMNRIRGVLHNRAKALYTEAILAEGYSDFEVARQKFQECMDTAPKSDPYYQRAQRKLSRYQRKEPENP